MGRRESREAAVIIVFQYLFQEKTAEELVDGYFADLEDFDGELKKENGATEEEYIRDVVAGAIAHKDEAFDYISKTAKGWTLERMAKTDVAVLMVAFYEIFYKADVPASVAINEAIDIAKKYSREDAGVFVNGILGSIYRMRQGDGEDSN